MRSIKTLVLVVVLLPTLWINSGSAQIMDVAPIVVWAEGRVDSDGPFTQFVVGTKRAIPVFDLLPQVTADSFFDMLQIVVGAENDKNTDKTRFRYRLTALTSEIQKSPWGTGFTFLDYDASGMQDLWADWVAVSMGPGFHIPAGDVQIVVRAMGHLAFSTFRFGDIVFEELGREAGNSYTGGVYGGVGRVSIVWNGRFTARAMYDKTWSSTGPDPVKEQIRFRLTIHPGRGWGIFGTFERMTADLAELSQERTAFGGGVRYTIDSE